MNGAAPVEAPAPITAWAAAGFANELVPVCGPSHGCTSPGKRPHVPGWQTATFALNDFEPEGNIGLRTRYFPAIDIDVDDAAVVAAVEEVAREIFGSTARRSRRNSARCALLYRLDGEPFKKSRLLFDAPDGTAAKIELLGDGQQLVVDGTHASGARIEWVDPLPESGSLAPMTSETRGDFVRAVRGALEAIGCRDVRLDHDEDAHRNGAPKHDLKPIANYERERARKYGDGAITGARRAIEGKPEGERNDELNSQAFSLGQLVGGNVLDRSLAESELIAAGLRAGLTASETRATVRSGLDAGAKEPRALPADDASAVDPLLTILRDAWKPYTADELHRDPPPARYVWKPRIPAGKVVLLNATGGSYKTTLITYLAACRALGLPFLDGTTPTEGETVIFSAEDDREDFLRKLAALRVEWGDIFDATRVAERVHVIAVGGLLDMRLVASDYGQFRITSLADRLAEVIKERAPKADLIVLETSNRLGAGEGNEALGVLISACERLARLTSAAVLPVGHVSQEAALRGATHQHVSRGGTAGPDNARGALVLAPLTADNAKEHELDVGDMKPEEMKRYLVFAHSKGWTNGPKARPVVFERHFYEDLGPVLRRADFADRKAVVTESEKIERLRTLVERLTRQGVVVSERTLRGYTKDLDVPKGALGRLVTEAEAAKAIRKEKRKGRGGGEQLIACPRQIADDPRAGA